MVNDLITTLAWIFIISIIILLFPVSPLLGVMADEEDNAFFWWIIVGFIIAILGILMFIIVLVNDVEIWIKIVAGIIFIPGAIYEIVNRITEAIYDQF